MNQFPTYIENICEDGKFLTALYRQELREKIVKFLITEYGGKKDENRPPHIQIWDNTFFTLNDFDLKYGKFQKRLELKV